MRGRTRDRLIARLAYETAANAPGPDTPGDFGLILEEGGDAFLLLEEGGYLLLE